MTTTPTGAIVRVESTEDATRAVDGRVERVIVVGAGSRDSSLRGASVLNRVTGTFPEPHGRAVFASEHTCQRRTSTVDSAWTTGIREASRLRQLRNSVALGPTATRR